MRVVITGGAGFLGSRLAQVLLERKYLCDPAGNRREITELVVADVQAPAEPLPGVRYIVGDLLEPDSVAKVLDANTGSLFHLAAVVSAEAEANFELGMRVNFDLTRALIDRARKIGIRPRFVFTSSLAVFGADLPGVITDRTAAIPLSSYGTQKAMAELLINDASRKGFIDGRVVRLPTVAVRPGKPNRAASAFVSGILREPLAGRETVCPVPPETELWIASPRTVVASLIHAHDLAPERWGHHGIVNLPGITVRVSEMLEALKRAGGDPSLVRFERDPVIERIVCSWPARMQTTRATELGFPSDTNIDQIVRAYFEDYLGK